MSSPGRRHAMAVLGAYYTATGVAPFLSRRLFERMTGRKRDWWLVQTAGGLITSVGLAALAAAARDRVTPELTVAAAGSAATLAAVDLVHVARGTISPVYLADAAVELALVAALARPAQSWRSSDANPAARL